LLASLLGVRGIGPYRGFVLSNPYLELALPVGGAKLAAGRLMSKLFPKLGLSAGLKGSALTHDDAIGRAYDDDPLVFKKANVRWFTEATEAQGEVLATAAKMTRPLFVNVGTKDPVASPNGGRTFYERAGAKDKTKREWDGYLHELLMEPEWRGVADAIADWVLERAK